MSSAETMSFTTTFVDRAAAYGPLTGRLLGRRERPHGQLRAIADITIGRIVDVCDDLAIADRVAFVLAHRTGVTHAVLAVATEYLVASVEPQLTAGDAHALSQEPRAPRMISIATDEGVTPVLGAMQALSTAHVPHARPT